MKINNDSRRNNFSLFGYPFLKFENCLLKFRILCLKFRIFRFKLSNCFFEFRIFVFELGFFGALKKVIGYEHYDYGD